MAYPGEPQPRRIPRPGYPGEPAPRPGPRVGERVGPGLPPREPAPRPSTGPVQQPTTSAPQATYKSFAPEEVAQRRSRFAQRQREYSNSNTQTNPFRPTAPSGNQFV